MMIFWLAFQVISCFAAPSASDLYLPSQFGEPPTPLNQLFIEDEPYTTTPLIKRQSAKIIFEKGVQEVSLIASDLGFFPKKIFVTSGIPVRIYATGVSKKTLCIMIDYFSIRTQVHTQKISEMNFLPTAAGEYRYYCPINGMEGFIVVRERVDEAKKE